uniref:Uncharacterized protein n=1 Tax=Arthrobacter sp. J3.49 TaxID=347213 RepID=I3W1M6_9MICC|nr:hypothetical protein [Arthrobacter sp. J3.49]
MGYSEIVSTAAFLLALFVGLADLALGSPRRHGLGKTMAGRLGNG